MTSYPNITNLSEKLDELGRESINITDVRLTPLTYKPPGGGYVHECGPVILTKYDIGIVEIFTDRGVVGIGPSYDDYNDDFSQLIGKNPFDVLSLDLRSGLDVACWDIIGKVKGLPVYELLAINHTPIPRVPVYASGGVSWTYYDKEDGNPYGVEALIEEALRNQALGFDTFKWRPGTDWEEAGITPSKLGEICRQLREAVGPDFKMGLEKKGYDSWTFEECLEMAPIISELNFHFFEQPMGDKGPEQFDDYRTLKEHMPNVMLWGGEQFRCLDDAAPWLEQKVYDAVQADSSYLGLTEHWQVAQIAAKQNVKLVPHNWSSSLGTMCNTHLVAAVPTGTMVEFFMYDNAFREGLFTEPYRPVNGIITLSEKPGFGMELQPDLDKKFPHIPGPNTVANPRFPHAWNRAKAREKQISRRYSR